MRLTEAATVSARAVSASMPLVAGRDGTVSPG
jgi:hypothetical protein